MNRSELCSAVLALCSLVASSAGAETFADWQTRWEDERGAVLQTYEERIAAEGLRSVYDDLQGDVATLTAASDEERRWKRSFVCAMRSNLNTDGLSVAIDTALNASTENDLSSASLDALQRAANADAAFRGDPFRSGELGDGRQVLLAEGNLLLDAECPDHEISVDLTSESATAQSLFQVADILSTSLQNERLPLMEATAMAIHRSRSRWDAFFTNAMLDQYPWETYANELTKDWLPSLRGTLSQPPAAQLRIAHPTPVVVYNDSGTTFEPTLAVEALGWRVYDTQSYEPRWGLSLISVLKSASDTSTGYGLLLVAKTASLGVIVRDTPQRSADVQLLLGVDIAQLFQNSGAGRASRLAALEAALDRLSRCSKEIFRDCE